MIYTLASPSAPSCVKELLQETSEQRATQGKNENSPSRPDENGIESFELVAATSEKQIPYGNDKQEKNHKSKGDDKPYGNDKQMAQQVYAVYPKKVGNAEALKSIAKAIARLRSKGTADPVAYLIARIEAWLTRRARDAAVGEFVPHYPNPATWFNQERFNDDPETWIRKPAETTARLSDLKLVRDAKQAVSDEIKRKHRRDGIFGGKWTDENARLEFSQLSKEIRELNGRIAGWKV